MPLGKIDVRFHVPGHKIRRNKDGSVRHGWAARHDLVKHTPKWSGCILHPKMLICGAARRRPMPKAAAEMLAWASRMRSNDLTFDGTVVLVRAYYIRRAPIAVSNGTRGERTTRFSA